MAILVCSQPWYGESFRSTLVLLQWLFFLELWASMYLTTWPYYLDLWTLTSPVTAHVGDAGHRTQSLKQVFKFVGLPFGRYGTFSVSELIDLETLTFDLSTYKWGHGSPVSCASFLSIFGLLCPFILDLGSGTEQTDGQTTVINALCPTIRGGA